MSLKTAGVVVGIVLLLGIAALCGAQEQAKGKRVLVPFNYQGVTLEDGPLKRQFDETRDFYLRIPNDDLLKGFRKRAGLPAPGVDLGGWYSGDIFHIFGQILSGLARMYAATGDVACRDKADTLTREWSRCIARDGFFYFSEHPNAPHYIYDKMVGGLVDVFLYCGNSEALVSLSRITDWAVQHLDRKRPYGADFQEWYTLSENLYRAYLATGDTKYRDFARVWEYTEYWNRYALGQDIFGPGSNGQHPGVYHAYSHVNTLGGNGAAYLVTGDNRYLETLRNAYDYLQGQQCFATGGYGPDEQLLPHAPLLEHLQETHNTFETQCGSWAAFKMAKYLISFTGEARYGDWVERLVLNGIGASIPMAADGRVFYYSDYNPSGAAKTNCPDGWTCCAGTRPMAIADYHDLIYFRSPDSTRIYVNLYTPSTLRWELNRQPAVLRQRTRFPEANTTEFTLTVAHPAAWTLALRMPAWLSRPMEVSVNGRPIQSVQEHGWTVIERIWKTGDHVVVRLPMAFHTAPLDPPRLYPTALLFGPVVLAVRSTPKEVAGKLDLDHLEQNLVASPGEPLTWHLASVPQALVRPFFAVKEREPYLLYLDPKAANRISHRAVTFNGAWNQGGQFRFSNVVGASAEVRFEGTGIRWLGYRFDDAGRAEVRVDGKVVATVDQYGPGRGLPFDWRVEGLVPGKHIIKITVLPDKSPESKDRYLNVAGFELL